ncbi:MAG: peptide chain release factor N(5)-glutamine methyltransferase [Planctomycetota bacterium]|nr:peptide chain release factor N(5)-glutamine methyltransferase [Planctomycetota bacterium]
MKPQTAGEMVKLAREFLSKKGIEEARLESELLVAHALGLDRLKLFLQHDRPLADEEIARARELLVRRGKREPTAYLTGKREFYGRPFLVGPGALIPRPETELVVDRAREIARARAASGEPLAIAADFGTGSGVLAITLALEVPGLEVYAVEASEEALAWARRNAEALCTAPLDPDANARPAARVEFARGDGYALLAERAGALGRGFDLVVANPPYVTRDEAADLAPEVRDHEPATALFAPEGDPDHHLVRLLDGLAVWLAPGGTLLVELGHRQGARAKALAEARGLDARLHRDYGGVERVFETRRPGP